MRHQGGARLTGLAAHQGQDGSDLLGRLGRAAERRMAVGGLGHRGIAAAVTEAREVEGPGVEAARVPVVEPGTAAEIEADGQRRGKGGAVDIEDRRRADERLATDEQRRMVVRCRQIGRSVGSYGRDRRLRPADHSAPAEALLTPPPPGLGSASRARCRATGALWVSQPTEIRSTPVAAIAGAVSGVMPPEASAIARPPIAAHGLAQRVRASCCRAAPRRRRAASASSSWSSVSTSTSILTRWPTRPRARADRRRARRRRRRCGCP